MYKQFVVWALAAITLVAPATAAELTHTERSWLEGALPVLQFAARLNLPLDIVVQPQDTPGETPMGMAFVEGRCKLVLSMRGNPEAQATLDRMPPTLLGPLVEAIAAHEMGHCWRHLSGGWGQLPPELEDRSALHRVQADHAELLREMWRTRREEAYADLVGLAWTWQQHPARYAEVHAWYVRLRALQDVDTGPHDTRAWVQLAGDPSLFTEHVSLFDRVQALWVRGMLGPSPLARVARVAMRDTAAITPGLGPP